ncbi:MAG: PhzF family phenazine biosynthesis protein [Bacteroidetes bacterium]|nr:PhzF family phenazine biosynthesis protein [Bacteroidota bacterium]MBU1373836.1 PhzF family phenazine biosynthesis protein [Bacteroidota bacterium]MBU1483942.1 PhzF family phenazine biosynthesis protein [Bacteroidota bacterium]MBU1761805.1 PhzF family phenazine biosynthesis protein [Bacteroidota bacterium]MBU2046684.1 PhzF family phenazine biosynthesis protein [Bacteroidota bacterium]
MKTYFVDSFTNEKFKGNPAAVCILENELNHQIMQNIAIEIGFSETAFIKLIKDNIYEIRFFTPKMEIPLCGHATLASSKIIFDTTSLNTIKFINCNDVELLIDKVGDEIKMQFPIYDTEEIEEPKQMLDALGIREYLNKRYSPKNKIILIEIKSSTDLANLKPDFSALVQTYQGINGVLVTAKSDIIDFDFQYRYFWPWAGTNEDTVTGGIQTFLTKYWANRLNKTTFKAFQSSLRTGKMRTELLTDKVCIYGEAVKVLEGNLEI